MPALDDYPHVASIPTRWADNDIYGHVNNVEYYAFFDTVINAYLIAEGGLDIRGGGGTIGLCAESHCSYRAPLAFPEVVQAGLAVSHLGRSSVRYELGLFRGQQATEPVATGWFVHVFVDPQSRRSRPIPDPLAAALERLLVRDGRFTPDAG